MGEGDGADLQTADLEKKVAELATFVGYPKWSKPSEPWWKQTTIVASIMASILTALWGTISYVLQNADAKESKALERDRQRLTADYERKSKLKAELDLLFSVQRGAYGTRCRLGLAGAYYETKERWLIRPQIKVLKKQTTTPATIGQDELERLERELEQTARSAEHDRETLKGVQERTATQTDLDLVVVNVEAFFSATDTREAAKTFHEKWLSFMAQIDPSAELTRKEKLMTAAEATLRAFKNEGKAIDLNRNAVKDAWNYDKAECTKYTDKLLILYRDLSSFMARDIQNVWMQ